MIRTKLLNFIEFNNFLNCNNIKDFFFFFLGGEEEFMEFIALLGWKTNTQLMSFL